MDIEQRMHKLKNGSDTAQWAAAEIDQLREKLAAMQSQAKPADKQERITEKDARDIAISVMRYCHENSNWYPDVWLEDRGRALLNKLNADREQVSGVAPAQEQWSYYKILLEQNGFDGITDLLAKYHKLVERVPAVAVADAERFCDSHCTWRDHHPDCPSHESEQFDSPATDSEGGA